MVESLQWIPNKHKILFINGNIMKIHKIPISIKRKILYQPIKKQLKVYYTLPTKTMILGKPIQII